MKFDRWLPKKIISVFRCFSFLSHLRILHLNLYTECLASNDIHISYNLYLLVK
jgi:hypothetical protein